MRIFSSWVIPAVAMIAAVPVVSVAADLPSPVFAVPGNPSIGTWKYQVAAYGWATSLDGSVGVAGLPPTNISVPFSKLLSHLDGALMGAFYANNGTWSFLADLMWARLGTKMTLNDLPRTQVDATQKQLIATASVGYRLPIGNPNLDLSAIAGVRYNRLTLDLTVQPGFLPLTFSRTWVKAWADPVIGLTAHYDINREWFINGLVDIGGFGVGSRLTAQAFAALGYNWSANWSTALGYRALYTNYRNGGFVYNVTQHGPFMSMVYHF